MFRAYSCRGRTGFAEASTRNDKNPKPSHPAETRSFSTEERRSDAGTNSQNLFDILKRRLEDVGRWVVHFSRLICISGVLSQRWRGLTVKMGVLIAKGGLFV